MEKWTKAWIIISLLVIPVFCLFVIVAGNLGNDFQLWVGGVVLMYGCLFLVVLPFTDIARKFRVRPPFIVLGFGGLSTGFGVILRTGVPADSLWPETLVYSGALLCLGAVSMLGWRARKARRETTTVESGPRNVLPPKP